MSEFNSFGNSILGVTITCILVYIFFEGDPDVVDAIIKIILEKAGL